jgi:hypothetical protein
MAATLGGLHGTVNLFGPERDDLRSNAGTRIVTQQRRRR